MVGITGCLPTRCRNISLVDVSTAGLLVSEASLITSAMMVPASELRPYIKYLLYVSIGGVIVSFLVLVYLLRAQAKREAAGLLDTLIGRPMQRETTTINISANYNTEKVIVAEGDAVVSPSVTTPPLTARRPDTPYPVTTEKHFEVRRTRSASPLPSAPSINSTGRHASAALLIESKFKGRHPF